MVIRLPVLTFHSIDQSRSIISFSPELFKKIISTLKSNHYKALSLGDVVAWLKGEKDIPERSVVITFDDGLENVYHEAFHILEEAGFTATLFLTTGYAGKTNSWPTQISGIPEMKMLNWSQIKEMAKSVFDIEAHTQTHPFLSRISKEDVYDEIVGSKVEIENRVGKKVNFFAYPYGDYNFTIYEFVGSNFEGSCSTNLGYVTLKSLPFLLERHDMYYFSGSLSSVVFNSFFQNPYLLLCKSIRNMRRLAHAIGFS